MERPEMPVLKIIVSVLLLASSAEVSAAAAPSDTLTLSDLHGAVRRSHPVSGKKLFVEQRSVLSGRNLTRRWLPRLDLEGQAAYQSEVTSFDPELPPGMQEGGFRFPSPDKDRYDLQLKLSQMIFDGGVTSARRELLERETAAEKKEIELELYRIRRVINSYFFSILMLRREKAVAGTLREELRQQYHRLASARRHGAAAESAVYEIEARMIQSEQKIIEIGAKIHSACGALSELTGVEVDSSAVLKPPRHDFSPDVKGEPLHKRPDLQMYDLLISQSASAEKVIMRENYPKVYGFASLGYGRPGLDMMSQDLHSYYTAGVKLSWNILDWGNNRREREIQNLKESILRRSRESLLRYASADLRESAREIEKYYRVLRKDERILELRERIAGRKRSRFRNGDITADEYITEINRLERARLNREKHRVALQRALTDYLMIKGEL
jgi:outer membrane protein TolC